MASKRILSGMRPSGRLHLGHLEGVLKNWIELQEKYDCYFFVADWHALTDNLNTGEREDNILQMLADWLSVGIDPGKCTVFIQSEVPMHAELHLILSMVTPVGWLERCPTYKDKLDEIGQAGSPSYGLLGYPVLQAADILMYRANLVPVGQDQVAHLEISREIARRFNSLYGEVFPEPQPLLAEAAKLPGLDGRKMSKSYGNSILMSDSRQEIEAKVRTMLTDPSRAYRKDPGHPGVCCVYSYHELFARQGATEIASACEEASIGCTDCKEKLSRAIDEYLAPLREKREKIADDKQLMRDVLDRGAASAAGAAVKTMESVKKAMRFA